ncbi:MAG: cytochrome b/b6 domain-containing protein, partial [Bacteroidales bacterium]|nr:cytochrome b/b6 domain-containing protein [Bacteroidales bacterium]
MYFYPIWIRIWHWITAILCLLLIVTGISMQYSSMGAPLIRFDKAISIHNFCGIALTLSYLIFFIGNLRTENGKHYLLQYKGLGKRISKQFRYYLVGMFRKEQPPFPINEENKFNPLQRVSYVL